jgi:phospho-2-dehydro-3-deoxyheptonate aldolase
VKSGALQGRAGNRDARVLRKAAHDGRLEGLINDPHLDNSFKINDGLRTARELLLQINEWGCRPRPNTST